MSLSPALFECLEIDLGEISLPHAEKLMLRISAQRYQDRLADALIFAAHPKTVSLGARDSNSSWPRDVLVSPSRLAREGIALVKSVRGGGVTFHWPGQLVCYPVLALRPHERDVRSYMSKLERIALECLESFGVSGEIKKLTGRHIGVWVGERKIVSMGVRISQWITSFGFAVNLEGDYHQAGYVRPCGLEGVQLVTLEEILGHAPSRHDAILSISRAAKSHLQREIRRVDLSEISTSNISITQRHECRQHQRMENAQ